MKSQSPGRRSSVIDFFAQEENSPTLGFKGSIRTPLPQGLETQDETRDAYLLNTSVEKGKPYSKEVHRIGEDVFDKTVEFRQSFRTSTRSGGHGSQSPHKMLRESAIPPIRQIGAPQSPMINRSVIPNSISKGESISELEAIELPSRPSLRVRRPSVKNFIIPLERQDVTHKSHDEAVTSLSEIKDIHLEKGDEFYENFKRFKKRIAELKADIANQTSTNFSPYQPAFEGKTQANMFPSVFSSHHKLPKFKKVNSHLKKSFQLEPSYSVNTAKVGEEQARISASNKVYSSNLADELHPISGKADNLKKPFNVSKVAMESPALLQDLHDQRKFQSMDKPYSSQQTLQRNIVLGEYEKYKRNHRPPGSLPGGIGTSPDNKPPFESKVRAGAGDETFRLNRLKKLFNICE